MEGGGKLYVKGYNLGSGLSHTNALPMCNFGLTLRSVAEVLSDKQLRLSIPPSTTTGSVSFQVVVGDGISSHSNTLTFCYFVPTNMFSIQTSHGIQEEGTLLTLMPLEDTFTFIMTQRKNFSAAFGLMVAILR